MKSLINALDLGPKKVLHFTPKTKYPSLSIYRFLFDDFSIDIFGKNLLGETNVVDSPHFSIYHDELYITPFYLGSILIDRQFLNEYIVKYDIKEITCKELDQDSIGFHFPEENIEEIIEKVQEYANTDLIRRYFKKFDYMSDHGLVEWEKTVDLLTNNLIFLSKRKALDDRKIIQVIEESVISVSYYPHCWHEILRYGALQYPFMQLYFANAEIAVCERSSFNGPYWYLTTKDTLPDDLELQNLTPTLVNKFYTDFLDRYKEEEKRAKDLSEKIGKGS